MDGIKKFYQLTHPQLGVWYTEKLYSGTSIGNIAATLKIKGAINYELLESSINMFIKDNEGMRLRVVEIDGEPYQYISEIQYTQIDYLDFSESGVNALYEWDTNQTQIPFNLFDSNLFYFAIFRLSDDEGGFYIKMHHVISDAWSFVLLGNQIMENYNSLVGNDTPAIRSKPSYTEYVDNEKKYFSSERFISDKNFWTNKLADFSDIAVLKSRKAKNVSSKARRKSFIIPQKLYAKLLEHCKKFNTTIPALFVSAIAMYINRVTGKEDIVIGTTTLNRINYSEKNMVGMFVNTLLLRTRIEDNMDFITFGQNLTRDWIDLLKHQKYPYDLLLKDVRDKNKITDDLFDIGFSYQNAKVVKDHNVLQSQGRWHFNGNQRQSLNIHLNEREVDERIIADYDYLVDIYYSKEIDFIHDHIIRLLWHALDNPGKDISRIDMISEQEKHKILKEFNDTDVDYPKDLTIHKLFEQQAAKTPQNIALIYDNIEMTYIELDKKANQLADIIYKTGLEHNKSVSLLLDSSFEMVIGMLGVLKAGYAYIPIDPNYPEDRIRYTLNDSKSPIVITRSEYAEKYRFTNIIIDFDKLDLQSEDTKSHFLCAPEDIAYMIYTSGTTGNPKAVMVQHKSIVNTLLWRKNYYGFSISDTVLQIPSYAFDASVEDIFTPLISGSRLVIQQQQYKNDVNYVSELVKKYNVTHFLLVASLYNLFVNEIGHALRNVKFVTVGGEEIGNHLVRKHYKILPDTLLYNEYGPTENSVCTTVYKFVNGMCKILIGKPIWNNKCYILDKNKQILPIGIAGELYIGGVGIAKGYLNRPELTSEKFIESPFIPGERLYISGDMARWLANGDIEYLGRVDNQVKIRGYRIELGEIESKLLCHEGINEAVVIDKEDDRGRKYLCAYVVADNFSGAEINAFLKKELPSYMIPAYIIKLDRIPLTSNGKIDRKALPSQDTADEISTEYIAPCTETEQTMAMIWSEVLSVKKVGIKDNFFESGGDSLNAMALISRIHKEFNVDLTMEFLFNNPTIAQIADYIASCTNSSIYKPINAAPEQEYYDLSPGQKRLFLFSMINGSTISYNIPGAIMLEGSLDIARFNAAFDELMDKHDILKTSFHLINGVPMQKVNKGMKFTVDLIKVDSKNMESILNNFIRPFDLAEPPLLRVTLLELAVNKYMMLFDMHHIISDGITTNILLKEFSSAYNGHILKKMELQYKDYALWQCELLRSEITEFQEQYWLDVFSGELPELNLPLDYTRPVINKGEGKRILFQVDKNLAGSLKKLAVASNTTTFIVLLSAYYVLLSKYTGQEDIIIGTPVSGRVLPELDNMLGMFVNTIALRNRPIGDKRYIDFLNEVKRNFLDAMKNQDYPFENIVSKLKIQRNLGRNPLFDTMFSMRVFDMDYIGIDGVKITPCKLDFNVSNFDISLEVIENNELLKIEIEYSSEIISEKTANNFFEHYINILQKVVSKPDLALSEICMIPDTEYKLINYDNGNLAIQNKSTIKDLFEASVKKAPDNIAIIHKDGRLTYEQLNKRANQMARLLQEKGTGPEAIVGLLFNRTIEMIISILAVVKAGGVYLPIDPDHPESRIDFIIKDSGMKLMLTDGSIKPDVGKAFEIINVTEEKINEYCDGNLPCSNKPGDAMYIIYTSGTTGFPKGVIVEHKNAVAYVNAFLNEFMLNSYDIVLQQASYTFDTFVEELYPILLTGGKLIILDEFEVKDIRLLHRRINENKVTLVSCSPLLLNELNKMPAIGSVHTYISGGDVLKYSYISNIVKQARVYNTYGPTETTVCSCYYKCNPEADGNEIPIGKPISNYDVVIMDKYGIPLPAGIPGEICISGAGVARGYLNRDELNKSKFIYSSFLNNSKIYKTGDIGKYGYDGNIYFLGRIDNQVKIRGYRIELSEIEAQLLECDSIDEAIVIDNKDSNGNRYLCAYIVPKEKIVPINIRNFLEDRLPDFMIPAKFIRIPYVPLTKNGKVDRGALKKFNENILLDKQIIKPINETEKKLYKLWCEILGINDFGTGNNFFELGGDSLKATMLQFKIYDEFNIEMPLFEIFQKPTISEIAKNIRRSKKVEFIEKDSNLVLLKKGRDNSKNFFFIHAGHGEVEIYTEFCSLLDPAYNYWGIRADRLSGYGPKNITVEEIARKYLGKILLIDDKGPYNLAGWCVGSYICLEIAAQLKLMGKEVGFTALIDPPQYMGNDKIMQKFTAESEKEFIIGKIPQLNGCLTGLNDMDIIWEYIVDFLNNNPEFLKSIDDKAFNDIVNAMPDEYCNAMSKIVYYLNVVRTFDSSVQKYSNNHKPCLDVNIFHVKDNKLNRNYWRSFCRKGEINFIKLRGDHFSIFKSADIDSFAEVFKSLFAKSISLIASDKWVDERCEY